MGNRIHNPLLKSLHRAYLVPAASKWRAADIFRPSKPEDGTFPLSGGQVLRTCLAVNPHSLFPLAPPLSPLSACLVLVDYVNRNREKPCHVNHPGHGLMFHPHWAWTSDGGYIRRCPAASSSRRTSRISAVFCSVPSEGHRVSSSVTGAGTYHGPPLPGPPL